MSPKEIADLGLGLVQALLSWPVVALIAAFALRRHVPAVIDYLKPRLKKFQLGPASLELGEPKTTETAFGRTNVSAIPTPFETDSLVFRSRRFDFDISYPAGDRWMLDYMVGGPTRQFAQSAQADVAVVIRSALAVDGFAPNVTVVMQPVGSQSVEDYVADSAKSIIANGGSLLGYDIDPVTKGASVSYTLSFSTADGPLPTLNVARVSIAKGFACLATSTVKHGSPLPPQLREELSAILNSVQSPSSVAQPNASP